MGKGRKVRTSVKNHSLKVFKLLVLWSSSTVAIFVLVTCPTLFAWKSRRGCALLFWISFFVLIQPLKTSAIFHIQRWGLFVCFILKISFHCIISFLWTLAGNFISILGFTNQRALDYLISAGGHVPVLYCRQLNINYSNFAIW